MVESAALDRLMRPRYVKPCVKWHENDWADAEAICETVTRPIIRFVPIQSEEQQVALVIHRVRSLLVQQKAQPINGLNGHLAEFSVVAAQGAPKIVVLTARLAQPGDEPIPAAARTVLQVLVERLRYIGRRIGELNDHMAAQTKQHELCRRPSTIQGIRPIMATLSVATMGGAMAFTSRRHLTAWLSLLPRQHSTSGKERLCGISHAGDGCLRCMLVHGTRAVVRWRRTFSPWLAKRLERRPVDIVVVALANKTARIAWPVLRRGENYYTFSQPMPTAA